jgi:tRNA U34 2-thiouridine synthase MnmA/TrmU
VTSQRHPTGIIRQAWAQVAVTHGQPVVFYDEDVVAGGGWID